MWPLSILATRFNQFSNKLHILDGGVIFKVMCKMQQMIFENGHVLKICSIVSSLSQKQH
jgi:hypothetical protein